MYRARIGIHARDLNESMGTQKFMSYSSYSYFKPSRLPNACLDWWAPFGLYSGIYVNSWLPASFHANLKKTCEFSFLELDRSQELTSSRCTPSYKRNASNDFRTRPIETVSTRERLHRFARLWLFGSLPFLVIRRVPFVTGCTVWRRIFWTSG